MSRRKRRDLFFRIIQTAVYLYIMYAGLWVICWLVGEIFERMGVA